MKDGDEQDGLGKQSARPSSVRCCENIVNVKLVAAEMKFVLRSIDLMNKVCMR